MSIPPDTGSHAAEQRRGGLSWLWILLAVILAAIAAWWLFGVLADDEDPEAAPTAAEEVEEPVDSEPTLTDETTPEGTPADDDTAAPTGETAPPDARVVVGDVDLFTADVDLASLVGESVEAEGAEVQAVVADEAFFVGPEPDRTVLVRLPEFAGGQESPFDVQEGDEVSFTGTLEEVDEALLSELQLDDPPQVETGDVYVQVEELELAS